MKKQASRHTPAILAMLLCTVLALLALPVEGSHAQQPATDQQSLGNAEATFERAKTILESDSQFIPSLENLRADLVGLRDAASAIVEEGSVEGRAIQAQIDSLGPPPAEGAEEPQNVADRRAALRDAYARATEPVRNAQETLERSELFIREVDQAIRRLSRQELAQRFPTPLNPANWDNALAEVSDYVSRVVDDTRKSVSDPDSTQRLVHLVPTLVILVVFGLLVLFVAQPLLFRFLSRLAGPENTSGWRWIYIVLANVSRIIMPAIGVGAILMVVPLLDIRPAAIRYTLPALPVLATIMILAHWLGHTVFAPDNPQARLINMDDRRARTGLRLCQGLGLMLVLEGLLESIEHDTNFDPATAAVVSVPFILLMSLFLWRFSVLLRSGRNDDVPAEPSPDQVSLDAGFLKLISRAMLISAVVATLLVLLGFVNLSRAAIVPMILSIGLLGFALFLYHVILGLFHKAFRQSETGSDATPSLLPICVIFILALAAAPMLALFWGARASDISEVWRLLTNGVQLGEVRISLDVVITLVIVFTAGMLITRWLQLLLRVNVLPRTRLDLGARSALVTGVGYTGLALSAVIAVSTAGLDLSAFAVAFGALGVGIGFGLQNIVSNFVSGIILLVERPIKEGDWIEVSSISGNVKKISVRSTRIRTFDGHDVIVPNSDLMTGTVKNMTLSSQTGRLIVPVGVAYGSDLEKTRDILLEAAGGSDLVLSHPEPMALFMGLGDSSLDFELRCFLKDVNQIINARSELLFKIYLALGEAGIEIPFPQRDIHLRDIDRLVEAVGGTGPAPQT